MGFLFKRQHTQQKDIKIGMRFSNLLSRTVFYPGIKLQFSEKNIKGAFPALWNLYKYKEKIIGKLNNVNYNMECFFCD